MAAKRLTADWKNRQIKGRKRQSHRLDKRSPSHSQYDLPAQKDAGHNAESLSRAKHPREFGGAARPEESPGSLEAAHVPYSQVEILRRLRYDSCHDWNTNRSRLNKWSGHRWGFPWSEDTRVRGSLGFPANRHGFPRRGWSITTPVAGRHR